MQETKQAPTLNRSLGFWSALSLVVGTVIGSGIFFKQSSVLDSAGSPSAALLAWLLGGLITLTAGLTIAEVGAQMPHTGGLYVYMEQIYGKLWGFLSGWMQIAVYGPAIIASIGAYLGILLVGFFNLQTSWQAPLSIGVIVLIGILNMFENRWGAAFQIATTLGKLLPIAAIIIFGLFYGNQNALGQSLHTITQSTGSFGVAVLATLFAYDGWILVANLGGEIKNPQKLLPQAIILGISMVLIAYTLVGNDPQTWATNDAILCPSSVWHNWRAPTEHRDHYLDGGLFKRQNHDLPPHRVRHGCSESAAIC